MEEIDQGMNRLKSGNPGLKSGNPTSTTPERKTAYNGIALVFLVFLSLKVFLQGVLFLLPTDIVQAYSQGITGSDLIKLTNSERKKLGLKALKEHPLLSRAAHNKAADLLERNYFAHTSPDGKPFYKWFEDVGYDYLVAGENLAIDFVTSDGVVRAWMKSPKHKENIINQDYTEIGMAVLNGEFGSGETAVVAALYGKPNSPIVANKPKALRRGAVRGESLAPVVSEQSNLALSDPRARIESLIKLDFVVSLMLLALFPLLFLVLGKYLYHVSDHKRHQHAG